MSSSSRVHFIPRNNRSAKQKNAQVGTVVPTVGESDVSVMTANRHTVQISLRAADHPLLSRVLLDPSLRVMVFCAGDSHDRQDIAFPHQSEIKVNGGDVKANLRGLKNKPGSTRPVDITKDLRLKVATYTNNVDMTYALTNKASESSSISACDPISLYLTYALPFSVFCVHLLEEETH